MKFRLQQLIANSAVFTEIGSSEPRAPTSISRFDEWVELIQRCASTHDIDSVCQRIRHNFGFDFYALFVRVPSQTGKPTCYFLREYENAWTAHYDEHKFMFRDPTIREAFISTAPYVWSTSFYHQVEEKLLSSEHDIAKDALDFGLVDIFNAPFRGPFGDVGLIRFINLKSGQASTIEQGLAAEKSSQIFWLASQIYERLVCLIRGGKNLHSNLSQRECDILQWTALGYTPDNIADRLLISEHTVTKHLANVRKKLGVRSTTHAVALAVANRLIFV